MNERIKVYKDANLKEPNTWLPYTLKSILIAGIVIAILFGVRQLYVVFSAPQIEQNNSEADLEKAAKDYYLNFEEKNWKEALKRESITGYPKLFQVDLSDYVMTMDKVYNLPIKIDIENVKILGDGQGEVLIKFKVNSTSSHVKNKWSYSEERKIWVAPITKAHRPLIPEDYRPLLFEEDRIAEFKERTGIIAAFKGVGISKTESFFVDQSWILECECDALVRVKLLSPVTFQEIGAYRITATPNRRFRINKLGKMYLEVNTTGKWKINILKDR